jgi:hypothetical protein
MHGNATVVHCAANMRDASPTRRLASCTVAPPTPRRRRR